MNLLNKKSLELRYQLLGCHCRSSSVWLQISTKPPYSMLTINHLRHTAPNFKVAFKTWIFLKSYKNVRFSKSLMHKKWIIKDDCSNCIPACLLLYDAFIFMPKLIYLIVKNAVSTDCGNDYCRLLLLRSTYYVFGAQFKIKT